MATAIAKVDVKNLHVVITHDDGAWFAQCAEIDYAAQGANLEDVQKRFQEGLTATFDEHLRVYGTIEHFLKFAPIEVWKELVAVSDTEGVKASYSQISTHAGIPYSQIKYVVAEKKAA